MWNRFKSKCQAWGIQQQQDKRPLPFSRMAQRQSCGVGWEKLHSSEQLPNKEFATRIGGFKSKGWECRMLQAKAKSPPHEYIATREYEGGHISWDSTTKHLILRHSIWYSMNDRNIIGLNVMKSSIAATIATHCPLTHFPPPHIISLPTSSISSNSTPPHVISLPPHPLSSFTKSFGKLLRA